MKALVPAFLTAGICAACLFRVFTVTSRELGLLSGPVERIVQGWKEKPVARRVITIVLSDRRAGPDPLALQRQPPWPQQIADWARSRLVAGAPAGDSTSFVLPFKADPGLVAWSMDGFADASPPRVTRELRKVILQADSRQVELNIVAHGPAAGAAVLLTLTELGAKGEKARASKVVLVGQSRLWARYQNWPVSAEAPANASELVEIYTDGRVYADHEAHGVRRFDLTVKGETNGRLIEYLWPDLGKHPEDIAAFVRELLARPGTLEDALNARQKELDDIEAGRQKGLRDQVIAAQAAYDAQMNKTDAPAPARKPAGASASILYYTAKDMQNAADCCAAARGKWRPGSGSFIEEKGMPEEAAHPKHDDEFGCCSVAWPGAAASAACKATAGGMDESATYKDKDGTEHNMRPNFRCDMP